MSENTSELLTHFVRGGFENLVGSQPVDLANYLRGIAGHTGQSASLFIAEAIEGVHALFIEHDEYGGVRSGFIYRLDDLVCSRLPTVQSADPHWAAKLAKDFRDDILALVKSYDPTDDYE